MLLRSQPAELRFEIARALRIAPTRAQPPKLLPDLRSFGLDGCFSVYQCGAR